MMSQGLAQICRISSFPAVLPLIRTISKVPVRKVTAPAPQEGVLVPVNTVLLASVPFPSSGTHGCCLLPSLSQPDQFSALSPAQHTHSWAPGHVHTLNHDLHSQFQLPTPNPSLNCSQHSAASGEAPTALSGHNLCQTSSELQVGNWEFPGAATTALPFPFMPSPNRSAAIAPEHICICLHKAKQPALPSLAASAQLQSCSC